MVPRLVAAAAGAVLVVGCSDRSDVPRTAPSDVGAPAASETPETVPPATPGADIELRLEAGSATAQRGFDAPDPRTHTQIIEVTVDPAESPVTIDFTTATGSELHVLGPDWHDCNRDGERIMFLIRFPILEAQRSGRWTVTASKPDGPATAVAVRVRWEAVDNP